MSATNRGSLRQSFDRYVTPEYTIDIMLLWNLCKVLQWELNATWHVYTYINVIHNTL